MSLAKITLLARVLNEGEQRFTNDNKSVSSFFVQTGNGIRLRCNCWGDLAQSTSELKVGDLILIQGTLITHTQNSPDQSANIKTYEITAREIQILSSNQPPRNLPLFAAGNQNKVSPINSKNNDIKGGEDISSALNDEESLEEEVPF